MNQKKAKLIRKLTKETFGHETDKLVKRRYRKVKKAYNSTPSNQKQFFLEIVRQASVMSLESRNKL